MREFKELIFTDVLEIQMSQSRVTRSLVQFGQNGRIGQRVVQLVEVDNNFGHENVFFLTRELGKSFLLSVIKIFHFYLNH